MPRFTLLTSAHQDDRDIANEPTTPSGSDNDNDVAPPTKTPTPNNDTNTAVEAGLVSSSIATIKNSLTSSAHSIASLRLSVAATKNTIKILAGKIVSLRPTTKPARYSTYLFFLLSALYLTYASSIAILRNIKSTAWSAPTIVLSIATVVTCLTAKILGNQIVRLQAAFNTGLRTGCCLGAVVILAVVLVIAPGFGQYQAYAQWALLLLAFLGLVGF